MNNSAISPIFVVGTPRSGTTLTAKILGWHPHVFMPGETHFFDDIYSRRKTLGDPNTTDGAVRIAERLMSLYGRFNEPDDQYRLESLTDIDTLVATLRENCVDYEQVLTLFMSLQMQAQGSNIWGNNAPRDIFNIKDIKAFYPSARIVVCVRDPRDFLGSYKGKWCTTADKEEVERLKQLYHPVVTSTLWKSSMKQLALVEQVFPSAQIYILHYETLVTAPEECVRALCQHVSVDYDPRMLEVKFSNSSEARSGPVSIFPTSVGSWRERVSAEEAWFAQKICVAEMGRLNYSCDKLRVNYWHVLRFILTAPYALWKGLQANKHKRGPLLPYLYRRLASVVTRG